MSKKGGKKQVLTSAQKIEQNRNRFGVIQDKKGTRNAKAEYLTLGIKEVKGRTKEEKAQAPRRVVSVKGTPHQVTGALAAWKKGGDKAGYAYNYENRVMTPDGIQALVEYMTNLGLARPSGQQGVFVDARTGQPLNFFYIENIVSQFNGNVPVWKATPESALFQREIYPMIQAQEEAKSRARAQAGRGARAEEKKQKTEERRREHDNNIAEVLAWGERLKARDAWSRSVEKAEKKERPGRKAAKGGKGKGGKKGARAGKKKAPQKAEDLAEYIANREAGRVIRVVGPNSYAALEPGTLAKQTAYVPLGPFAVKSLEALQQVRQQVEPQVNIARQAVAQGTASSSQAKLAAAFSAFDWNNAAQQLQNVLQSRAQSARGASAAAPSYMGAAFSRTPRGQPGIPQVAASQQAAPLQVGAALPVLQASSPRAPAAALSPRSAAARLSAAAPLSSALPTTLPALGGAAPLTMGGLAPIASVGSATPFQSVPMI